MVPLSKIKKVYLKDLSKMLFKQIPQFQFSIKVAKWEKSVYLLCLRKWYLNIWDTGQYSDHWAVTNFFFEKCECCVVTASLIHIFQNSRLWLCGVCSKIYFQWNLQMNRSNIVPQLSVIDFSMGSVKTRWLHLIMFFSRF